MVVDVAVLKFKSLKLESFRLDAFADVVKALAA